MMPWIRSLEDIGETERATFGHKAWALGEMVRNGLAVPPGVGISAEAYRTYVDETDLRERIELIVRRKRFQDMRWEELWDASLRVRNLFLTTPLPAPMKLDLVSQLEDRFGDRAVAVRSSAPGEDSTAASFAGLHDSYLNVSGTDAVIEHVRKVWASLWSDAALAYRREAEPTFASAAMAVVVQELIVGRASGVAFGEAPDDPEHVVIESVHGLNEGLVDGSIEPDRWILSRADGTVLRHDAAPRKRQVAATAAGVRFEPLSQEQAAVPPLRTDQIRQVFELVQTLENRFGSPQDVEWTFTTERPYVLQSRPITARRGKSPVARSVDGRSWSSSLRKSLDYLLPLRVRVETELMPALRDDVRTLGQRDVRSLSDEELCAEIRRRLAALRRWESTYADELIPLAHAIRLFGLYYNEAVQPADPYEFLALLAATPMEGLRRNRLLEGLAAQVRLDPALAQALRSSPEAIAALPDSFAAQLDAFLDDFGHLAWGEERCFADRQAVIRHVLQLCEKPRAPEASPAADPEALGNRFLSRFHGKERHSAAELLDLARASYRLRDDDNIAIGGIRSRALEAADEGSRRLSDRPWAARVSLAAEEVAQALADPAFEPSAAPSESRAGVEEREQRFKLRARQIVGQSAGPGVATGKARVVRSRSDLFDFRSGEILVCDAIEPNMTFVVPLAAAVVERRGGMLIHGAIIAREYGLPCVTGIPDATTAIHSGDTLTVDGHLGIVTVG